MLHYLQILNSFSFLPATQALMKSYDLSLQIGSIDADAKFLQLDMDWDRSKKFPSIYSIRVLGSRSGETPPFESSLKTNSISLGVPEVIKSEYSLDQNGFGIFIFRAKGYVFNVSLRREFVSDARGYNGNSRTQSKEMVMKQIKEIAMKLQPEARDLVKSWKWQEKRIQYEYYRGN